MALNADSPPYPDHRAFEITCRPSVRRLPSISTFESDFTYYEEHSFRRRLDLCFMFLHSMDERRNEINIENGEELDHMKYDTKEKNDPARISSHLEGSKTVGEGLDSG